MIGWTAGGAADAQEIVVDAGYNPMPGPAHLLNGGVWACGVPTCRPTCRTAVEER
jgi:hypothetical protein